MSRTIKQKVASQRNFLYCRLLGWSNGATPITKEEAILFDVIKKAIFLLQKDWSKNTKIINNGN